MNPAITLALQTALGLISTGMEIATVLKGKDTLTNEELKAIIDKANAEQVTAFAQLEELLK